MQRVAHGDHGNEGTALSHDQAPEKYATRAAVLPVITTVCHRHERTPSTGEPDADHDPTSVAAADQSHIHIEEVRASDPIVLAPMSPSSSHPLLRSVASAAGPSRSSAQAVG